MIIITIVAVILLLTTSSSKVLASGLCPAGQCTLLCGGIFGECKSCLPGWWCGDEPTTAIRCPNGTSTNGLRSRENASDCIPCAEGSFAGKEGTGTCTQCSDTDNYRGRAGVTGATSFDQACEEMEVDAPSLSPALREYGTLEQINDVATGTMQHAKLNKDESELLLNQIANNENSAVMIYKTLPLVLDRQRRNIDNYRCSWYEPSSSATSSSSSSSSFPVLILCVTYPNQQGRFLALYAASMAFYGDDDAGLVNYDYNAPSGTNVLEVRNDYAFFADQSAELLIRVNLNIALADTTSTDATGANGVARTVVSINPNPTISSTAHANRACVCDYRPSSNCYLLSQAGNLSKFITNELTNIPEFSERLDLAEAVGDEFGIEKFTLMSLAYDSVNDLIYTVGVSTIVKISPMNTPLRILSTIAATDWASRGRRRPKSVGLFDHGFLGERNEYLVVAVGYEDTNADADALTSVTAIYVSGNFNNNKMQPPNEQTEPAYSEATVYLGRVKSIRSGYFLNSLNNNRRITQYAASSSSSSSSSIPSSPFPPSPVVVASPSSFTGAMFVSDNGQQYQKIRTGKFVDGCQEGHTSRTVNNSEILGNNQLVITKPGANCSLTISNIPVFSLLVTAFDNSSVTIANLSCSHGNTAACVVVAFETRGGIPRSLIIRNIFFSLAIGVTKVEALDYDNTDDVPLTAVFISLGLPKSLQAELPSILLEIDNVTSTFRRSAPISDSFGAGNGDGSNYASYYSVFFDNYIIYGLKSVTFNNIRIIDSKMESTGAMAVVALALGDIDSRNGTDPGFTASPVYDTPVSISNIEIVNTAVSSSLMNDSTMVALMMEHEFVAGALYITNVSISRCTMRQAIMQPASTSPTPMPLSSFPPPTRTARAVEIQSSFYTLRVKHEMRVLNIFIMDLNFTESSSGIDCRCLVAKRGINQRVETDPVTFFNVSHVSAIRIYGEILGEQSSNTATGGQQGNANNDGGADSVSNRVAVVVALISLEGINNFDVASFSELTLASITIKKHQRNLEKSSSMMLPVDVFGFTINDWIITTSSFIVRNLFLYDLHFEDLHGRILKIILFFPSTSDAPFLRNRVTLSSFRVSDIFLHHPDGSSSGGFSCYALVAPYVSAYSRFIEISNMDMKFSAANSKHCTRDNCSLIKFESSSGRQYGGQFLINNNSVSDEGRAVGGDVGDGQSTSLISVSDVTDRESDFSSSSAFNFYGNFNNGAILAGTTNRPRFSIGFSKWIFRCNRWDERLEEDFMDIVAESPSPPAEGQIISICNTKTKSIPVVPPTNTAILTKSPTPSSSISEKPTRSHTFSRTKSSTVSPPPTRTRSISRTRTISTSVTPPPTRTQTFSRTRTISPTVTPPPTRTMTFSRTRSVSRSLTPPPTATKTNTSTTTLSRTISRSDNTPSHSFGTVSDTEPTKSLTFHDDSIAGLDPAVLAATTATAQTITAVASALGSAPITAMALSKSLASLQLLGCPQFTPEGKRWSEVDPGFSWTLLPTVKIDLFGKDNDDHPVLGGYYRAAVVGFIGLSILGCIGGLVAKSLPKKLPRTDDDDLVILQDDEYDERIIDGKPVTASSLSTRGGRFLNLAASVSFTFVGQFFSVAGVVLSSEGGGVIDIILGIAPFLFTLPILAVGFVKLRDAITPRKKIVYKQPIIEINSRANTETLRIDTITRKNVVPYYCVPSFIAPTLDSIMKKKKEVEERQKKNENENENENDNEYDEDDFNNNGKEKSSMASFLRLKRVKYVLGLMKSPFGRFVFIGDLVWCVDSAYYKSSFQACKSDKERLSVVEGNLTITMPSLFFRLKGPMREAVEIAPGNNSKKKLKSKSKQDKNGANTTNTTVISASLRAKLSTYYVLLVTLSAIICSFLQGISRGLDNEKTICRTSIGINALVSVTMLLLILYLRPLIVPLRNILFTVLEVCGTIVSLAVFALTESYPDTFPKNVSSQVAAIQVLAVSSGTLVAMLLLVLKVLRLYLFSSAGLQVVDEEEFLKRKKMETEILFGSSDENSGDEQQRQSRKFIFLGENINNNNKGDINNNSEEMKTKNQFDTPTETNGEDMLDAPLLLPARHTRSRKNTTVTRSSSVDNVNNNTNSNTAINDEPPVHSSSNKKKRRRMVRRAQTFNDDDQNNSDMNNRKLTKENLDRLFKSDHLI